MASGTITGTTSNQYIDSKIVWSSTSDVATNSSSVTAKLYYRRNNTGYTTEGTGSFSITINGVKTTKNGVHLKIQESWELAMTATGTVEHNDDGSKSITISATGSLSPTTLASTTCSGTAKLDTIARASAPTVSASTVTMLGSVTITTNRKSSSFTHDLTYSFGGSTGTIATGVGASYTWTVPDLVSKIPNKASGTCTITCKTKSGSTAIGTKTVTLTLKIPEKSIPSASDVQMGKSVTIKTNRKSSGYTHIIKYAIGSTSDTVASGVTSSKAWTPNKNLAAYTEGNIKATCTITCETYNGTYKVGTATTQITLTVPDATVPTLNKSSIVLGDPITINTPREASCYVHDITYTLKADGSSEVAFTKDFTRDIATSYEWTPPWGLAPKIPSATKGTITVICKTRIGKDYETIVGTNSVSFAVTIPNNSTTQPKITAMSLTPVHSLTSAFNGIYVAGKTRVKVDYDAETAYSTIKSYETTVGTTKGRTDPYTSAVLSTSGTVKITGKVTDARGYSTTKTSSITVIDYSRPRIVPGEGKSKIICVRCNSDGKADPGGIYLLIQAGRKYSKVVSGGTQKNYCKMSYQWKTDAQSDSAYSTPVELIAKTASSDYVSKTIPNVVTSNTTAYNIRLIVEDDVGESETVTITVPTAFVTFHSPAGGHGFALGGYHDPAKKNVFDCKFNAEFNGDVCGAVVGLGNLPQIPASADANDYKTPGVFAVPTNAIAGTVANLPTAIAGTLRVWYSNGIKGSTITHIIQEYILYDNSATYRRYCNLRDSAWTYGSWTIDNGVVSAGETDGWTWKKYVDGTAECWKTISLTSTIDTLWGNVYSTGKTSRQTYPFAFTKRPTEVASLANSNASAWLYVDNAGTGMNTTTASARYGALRPTAYSEESTFYIALHVMGNWK